MRQAIELFRQERRARLFFAALVQSSLGTGAGYVALLLVAYDRFESAWAISLVLLADLIPAMLLGPLLGALADRWSRKLCAVLGDSVRGGAFIGVALVDSYEVTVLFALVGGLGTALFTPATLAGLPSLVARERLPAATSLYGAIDDLGYLAGPALAALALLAAGPELILGVNGATFLVSALVLASLRFGAAPALARRTMGRVRTLLTEARAGLREVAAMRVIRVVIGASTGILFFSGLFNVAELLFAKADLGAGDSGYGLLVAAFGAGFVAGSLAGSRGGDRAALQRRFLSGMLLMGLASIGAGLSPVFGVAVAAFALAGVGNGLLLVHGRLLMQTEVPDALMGRAFGVKDALTAWSFGVAFVVAGALVESLGARELIALSGAGETLVCGISALLLRRERRLAAPAASTLQPAEEASAS